MQLLENFKAFRFHRTGILKGPQERPRFQDNTHSFLGEDTVVEPGVLGRMGGGDQWEEGRRQTGRRGGPMDGGEAQGGPGACAPGGIHRMGRRHREVRDGNERSSSRITLVTGPLLRLSRGPSM